MPSRASRPEDCIGRATLQDGSRLVELMQEFHAESGYTLDQAQAAEAFSTLLTHPDLGAVWIASRDGTAAGYVVLTMRYSMDHGGLDGHVEDLFVRPAFRRQGVAAALLSELLAECRHRRCGDIHVSVGHLNKPAILLYRRFGLGEHRDGRIHLHGRVGST